MQRRLPTNVTAMALGLVVLATGAFAQQPPAGEIGFADLMPGGGHGTAGHVNVSTIEVFAKPVPR